ncbi:MAG: hypothetical protein AABZ58_11185, partial [Chloroflexota bacterium]
MNDERGLLIHRDADERVRRILRVVRRRGVGFVQPDRFVQAVLTQEFAIVGDDLRDGFGAKVDVRREDVEVIVVRGRGGIYARKDEEELKIRLALVDDVVPVGEPGEVNDSI